MVRNQADNMTKAVETDIPELGHRGLTFGGFNEGRVFAGLEGEGQVGFRQRITRPMLRVGEIPNDCGAMVVGTNSSDRPWLRDRYPAMEFTFRQENGGRFSGAAPPPRVSGLVLPARVSGLVPPARVSLALPARVGDVSPVALPARVGDVLPTRVFVTHDGFASPIGSAPLAGLTPPTSYDGSNGSVGSNARVRSVGIGNEVPRPMLSSVVMPYVMKEKTFEQAQTVVDLGKFLGFPVQDPTVAENGNLVNNNGNKNGNRRDVALPWDQDTSTAGGDDGLGRKGGGL
ncbi:hypothetical protein NE237_002936 [Protea cynaroides]|uniref:Uncharacterized protein n=1 Tax=Protea cynaroides TaxID=273540 RepID=A0A9Q0QS40_9MAGN|nr:hypothetical protein NE237_002936 [Protea cynaroides]